MSILRLSTLSLTVAIAVFALGYVNPSFADKTGEKHNHGDGGGGDVKTGTTFTVVIEAGTGDGNWVVTRDVCEGFTDSGKLHVAFPGDGTCATPHVMIGGAPYWVYALGVRPNRTDVQLFLTEVALVPHVQPGDSVYNLGRLTWTRTNLDGGSFQLEVDLKDQEITKLLDPGRGETAGPIAIGNIVYTPNPP